MHCPAGPKCAIRTAQTVSAETQRGKHISLTYEQVDNNTDVDDDSQGAGDIHRTLVPWHH